MNEQINQDIAHRGGWRSHLNIENTLLFGTYVVVVVLVIAAQAPKNLIHFVVENGTYEANGGHPIPGAGSADFAGFARAAGFGTVLEFSELADFKGNLGGLLQTEGPVFTALKVEPGPPPEMDYRMMHGSKIRDNFRAALRA